MIINLVQLNMESLLFTRDGHWWCAKL